MSNFYVTGGALRVDAPSYVERKSDVTLYNALAQGEFCYVLTPSQMGKTSLMARTAARLTREGFSVVMIDLTASGENLDTNQWYFSLLEDIGKALGIARELLQYWDAHSELGPLRRWFGAIKEVVLLLIKHRIVIFIDEIGVVAKLPFSADEFFAAIRECYQRREDDLEFKRITFCLLGVVTPSELLKDPRSTAFNIGQRIDLHDFNECEARTLAEGLGREARLANLLLSRILYWTGGHPYLTQRLCHAVAGDPTVISPSGVDRVCERLFLARDIRGQETNIKEVERQLLKRGRDIASVLNLYSRTRGLKRMLRVRDDARNPAMEVLRISGITRVIQGYLWVRNRIYYRVFDKRWIATNFPDIERIRQRRAFVKGALLSAFVLSIPLTLGLLANYQRQRAEEDERAAQELFDEASDEFDQIYKRFNQTLLALTSGSRAIVTPGLTSPISQELINRASWQFATIRDQHLEAAIMSLVERLRAKEHKYASTIIYNLTIASTYYKLGKAQEKIGKTNDALDAFEKAVMYQSQARKLVEFPRLPWTKVPALIDDKLSLYHEQYKSVSKKATHPAL